MSEDTNIFLSANWNYLAMLNYEVDPDILLQYVPQGTELDVWNKKTFVSMVGFLFHNTRVYGISVPFHRNFEEVNLRFYVRKHSGNEWKRGVVFIKELVPRPAIALIARQIYNENYVSLPMRHHMNKKPDSVSVEYSWRYRGRWNLMSVKTRGELVDPLPESQEEFITEHYWGYVKQKDGSTLEYQVEHPRWRIWQVSDSSFDGDAENLYGKPFVSALTAKPQSVFLAEGSDVIVRKGKRLDNK